jgi:hypothetical protein
MYVIYELPRKPRGLAPRYVTKAIIKARSARFEFDDFGN